MPFIPTIEAVRCSLNQKLFGQDVINTLWFSYPSEEIQTVSSLTTFATFLETWWDEQLSEAMSQDIELQSISVITQDSATSLGITATTAQPTGKVAGASLPSSNAVCISFRTGERGRSARGRNYVGAIPKTAVVGNTIASLTIADIEDPYNWLVNNTPSGWNWLVVSHVSGGVNRLFGLKQAVLSAVVTDTYLDSQRRRGTGRGN